MHALRSLGAAGSARRYTGGLVSRWTGGPLRRSQHSGQSVGTGIRVASFHEHSPAASLRRPRWAASHLLVVYSLRSTL